MRNFLVIILGVVLLAAPAVAGGFGDASANMQHHTTQYGNDGNVPPLVDVIILRPFGLFAVGLSAAMWTAGASFVALSPYGYGEYTEAVLMPAVRFTFATPLGGH